MVSYWGEPLGEPLFRHPVLDSIQEDVNKIPSYNEGYND